MFLSVDTLLPNPLCMGQFLHVKLTFHFSFSVSATFYLLLSLTPRTGSTAEQIQVQTLEPDCLGPDLSSAIY